MTAAGRTFLAFAILTLISFPPRIQAQDSTHTTIQSEPAMFSLDGSREPIALLDGLWRFEPGDDASGAKGWASPGLDDSAWPLIRSDKNWSDQGYKGMGGMAWYRVKVLVPAGEKPLSLYIPRIVTNYELYADGRLIGQRGSMPPRARPGSTPAMVFALPAIDAAKPHVYSLAVRVWHWQHWAGLVGGGLEGGVRIGETRLIRQRASLESYETAWAFTGRIFLALLDFVIGLTTLALFRMRSKEREYLWFGVWLVFAGLNRCLSVYTAFHLFDEKLSEVLGPAIQVVGMLASVAFYFHLLRGRKDRLYWISVGSLVFIVVLALARPFEVISPAVWNVVNTLLLIPAAVWSLMLLVRRTIEGLADARLLLAPGLLQILSGLTGSALWILYVTGVYRARPAWFYRTSEWPFPVSFTNIADGLFLIAMVAILIYRFARTSQMEERLESELEAARTVQQILVPEQIPRIPGFTIHTVYKPFGQVGGDFFQILPLEPGGVLVAIGDVSGKGMPAAMTVSLIVGALRMVVETTSSPAAILAALNRRLYGRNYGGFTTCAILRADLDGTLTFANAGHLSPYLYGAELALEGGLPLGLLPESSYSESTFFLGDNEQVTLVTDGVVEARSKSGELFGFDRTAAIASRTADLIGETAQHFGQDDDITVLTLTRP